MYVKNLASQFIGFCLVNASDGSALTGATVTAVRSIDGSAQAAVTGSVTEKGGGQYVLALSQADTNGNDISFLFTAAGAVPVEKTIVTTNSGNLGMELTILADAVAHGGATATLTMNTWTIAGAFTAANNSNDIDLGAAERALIAAAVMASTVETGITLTQAVQIIGATTAGKSTGGPTNPIFVGLDGSTPRVNGVADADGNRSAANYTV